jgi:hypothetical protein
MAFPSGSLAPGPIIACRVDEPGDDSRPTRSAVEPCDADPVDVVLSVAMSIDGFVDDTSERRRRRRVMYNPLIEQARQPGRWKNHLAHVEQVVSEGLRAIPRPATSCAPRSTPR